MLSALHLAEGIGPGLPKAPALQPMGGILAEEKGPGEKRAENRRPGPFLCTMAPRHGTLCLPPSAAALNPDQEEGLSLTEDGYDEAIRSGWR